MLSAAIAYRELDAETRAEAVRLLRAHPQRVSQEPSPPGLKDVALFMYAARWPDDVRGDPAWDHPEWHYINSPLRRDGVGGRRAPAPNILTALEEAGAVLQDPDRTAAERDVALCWVFHLVGDLHQPLHTVSLFSTIYPEGDAGGTRFFVRVAPDAATISLHSLWDNALGQEQGIRAVWNRSGALIARSDLARESFPELQVGAWRSWAAESLQHARDTAYPARIAGSRDPANGVLLPPGYGNRTQALAERRIVLAGYRLADLLTRVLMPKKR
jgi:hypothetical protein